MNNLKIIDKRGILFVDSRDVAKIIEKRHTDLLRDIKRYIRYMEEDNERKIASVDFFKENTYLDSKGEKRPCYEMTKKGCEFIANKLTGKKGVLFTACYINRFHEMEEILKEKQTQHWRNTRLESKTNRRLETDEIKLLVEYAKLQGSKNADKYYITFSKLSNKAVGLNSNQRDMATINQLNNLVLIENIINHIIKDGITKERYYREIYQDCSRNKFLNRVICKRQRGFCI